MYRTPKYVLYIRRELFDTNEYSGSPFLSNTGVERSTQERLNVTHRALNVTHESGRMDDKCYLQ